MRHLANVLSIAMGLIACPAVVSAQDIRDNGKGEISVGASYSSQYGAIAVLGFDGTNIGGSGVDASVNFKRGKTGQGGTARLRYRHDLATQRLGQNAQMFAGAEVFNSDWADEAYKSTSRKLTFGVSADLNPSLRYSTNLFWQENVLSGLGAGTSPLVLGAAGESTGAGIDFVAHIGQLQGGSLPVSGFQVDTGVTWAGLGQRKTSSVFAAATFAQPIGDQNAFVLRAETGNIRGLDGQSVSILDRAFLGGSGGPRGFAFGSIGPRDFVNGSIDTPLGGQRYSSASAELRRDVSQKLSIGLFADGGAVWDLGATPVTGASGVIDDGRNLRASAGITAYWDTALGKVNLSLSKPIKSQANDVFNSLSISLVSSF